MNKGVVMEVSGEHLIVMTPGGSFEQIPKMNRNCQVGEEIMYASRQTGNRQPAFAALALFVSAVVLCMVMFTGLMAVFADKSVVAYFSFDINPSVELGIDKHKRVRELRGLNEKGEALVQGLHFNGRTLDDVTDRLLRRAEQMNVFAAGQVDIVIASAILKEGVKLNEAQATERMKQQILSHVITAYPQQADKIQVTVFAAPEAVVQAARESGVSIGQYCLYLNAKSAGFDIGIEQFKNGSLAETAAEQGGMSRLIDSGKLEKEALQKLAQEEQEHGPGGKPPPKKPKAH